MMNSRYLYPVSKKGLWGYINDRGDMVVDFLYNRADFFREDFAVIKKGEHYLYLHIEAPSITKVLELPFIVDDAKAFSSQYGAVRLESGYDFFTGHIPAGSWVYVNNKGELVVPGCKYSNGDTDNIDNFAGPFVDGVAVVSCAQELWLINSAGHSITSLGCEPSLVANKFHNGLLAVGQEPAFEACKYGYIDVKGKWRIKPQYIEANDFSEGLACVKHDRGAWGAINEAGEVVVAFRQDISDMHFFCGGLCAASCKTMWGYIDKSSAFVVPPQFERAYMFSESGYAIVRHNGKYGVIDVAGTWKIKPDFDDINDPYGNGIFLVTLGSTRRYLNSQGETIYEFVGA